jgi:hypothetical protein
MQIFVNYCEKEKHVIFSQIFRDNFVNHFERDKHVIFCRFENIYKYFRYLDTFTIVQNKN